MALSRLDSSCHWPRALLFLALPGCLVSFNDYPLGDPKASPVSSAGVGAGGGANVVPGAGTDSGDTSGGGSAAADGTGASSGSGAVGGSSGAVGGSEAVGGSVATGGTDAAMAGTTSGGSESASGGEGGGAPDPEPNQLLVDDFEDGNAAILPLQGRSGSWYAGNDGRGQQTPRNGAELLPTALDPARGASAHGAHTFGGPFQSWGALIGTALALRGTTGVAYDLSGYQGLRFWVRSGATSPYAAKQVRLNFRTPATIQGGGCTVCADHFGFEVPLTSKWVQVEVPLASLRQTGYGRPRLASPDLQHAMGIELLFPVNVSFDLWIDDFELY